MNLKTKYYGDIEYKQEDIITFEKGLPSFESYKKFILFPVKENDLFSILHSIEESDVGFVVVSPFDVMKEYEFELDDKKLDELKITSKEQVTIVNTVTLNSKVQNITVNMRAPIVINKVVKIGQQVILNNDKYLIKHPLIEEE